MFDFAIKAEYKIEDNYTHHKKNILKSKFGLMPHNDLLCLEKCNKQAHFTFYPTSAADKSISIGFTQQTRQLDRVSCNKLTNYTCHLDWYNEQAYSSDFVQPDRSIH